MPHLRIIPRRASGFFTSVALIICLLISASGDFSAPALAQQNPTQNNGEQAAGSEAASENITAPGASPIDYHQAWFPIDALNPGLPETRSLLNRATPRATLEAYLDAAERNDFERAAHFLNLALTPQQEQAADGPELARELHEIMSRRVWIDWEEISDRPDAMQVLASDSNKAAGEPRRTLTFSTLDLNGRPVSFRLDRVKAPDMPPQWVISAQTVGNIGALYQHYGPGSLESALPEWLQRNGLGQIPLWKTLLIPILIGLTILVAWGVYRLTTWLASWAEVHWLRRIVEKAAAPLGVFAACLVAQLIIGTMLPLSGPVNSIAQPLIFAGIIAALTWLALRGFDTVLDYASQKYVGDIGKEQNDESRRLYTNLSVARRLALLIAFLAAGGLLLSHLDLYQTLGISLLASAGIFSLIFGFAAQTVLGNILASLQIAISKPIRIGDSVLYEGQWATVEEINYTYVLLAIWDDRRLVVPVQYFVSHPFENWSIKTSHILGTVNIVLDHRTNVSALREKFAEVVKKNEHWDGKVEPQTLVTEQDNEGMTVRFYASAKNSSDAWYLECAMREEMLEYVRDLEGPYYPQQRVLLQRPSNGQSNHNPGPQGVSHPGGDAREAGRA